MNIMGYGEIDSEWRVDPMDLHRAFTWTVHGEKLEQNIRFAKYKPESVDNAAWQKLLGPDVNNLSHLTQTYALVRAGIASMRRSAPGYFTRDDEHLLGVAGITHDWAEAMLSDISYGDKTEEDTQQEYETFLMMVGQLCGSEAGVVFRACREVIFNEETKLGKAFNAVERVGYTRTALRASRYVLSNSVSGDCLTSGLRWLTTDVLSRQIPALVQHASQLAPVEEYLQWQKQDITVAFEDQMSHPQVFSNYGSKSDVMQMKFLESSATWDTYTSANL
jgi:hypothetical protein